MPILKMLPWIASEKQRALDLVQNLCAINSFSHNLIGLKAVTDVLINAFAPLKGEITLHPLPPWKIRNKQGVLEETALGQALRIQKKSPGKKQVLLGGHMDTVFPLDSPFQQVRISDTKCIGPGVADMKGGLVVLWLALSALQKYQVDFSWEVLITPDEEIGSPGSKSLWQSAAKTADFALLFEPAFPDGSIVNCRKGSISFSVTVQGKSAHVGRAMHEGKNAVKGLTEFMASAFSINKHFPDTSLNIAHLFGGEALNIVPSIASCKGNLRSFSLNELQGHLVELKKEAARISQKNDLALIFEVDIEKHPKLFSGKTADLFNKLKSSAESLQYPLPFTSSGGVCDGNTLQEEGVPTIDSLGVIGGHLHTEEEYMEIESLVQRAQLTCHFIHTLVSEHPC